MNIDGGDKCPVNHDARSKMVESAKHHKASSDEKECPVDHTKMSHTSMPADHAALKASGAECPVDHEARSKFVEHAKAQAAARKASSSTAESAAAPPSVSATKAVPDSEGCDSSKMDDDVIYKSDKAYNVYGEVIDPTNMMPNPNQLPLPGQKKPLSVERVKVSGGVHV